MGDVIIRGMHGCSREDAYQWPKEAAVREKLEWFQDQKLGLMMHFGIYSQLGICESWPLSDGDADWSRSGYTWEKDPEVFRQLDIRLKTDPCLFQIGSFLFQISRRDTVPAAVKGEPRIVPADQLTVIGRGFLYLPFIQQRLDRI